MMESRIFLTAEPKAVTTRPTSSSRVVAAAASKGSVESIPFATPSAA